ncbi:MAG: hypothetical protein HY928_05065 [Elusimicrobia bacterium]|nr:hypothetical protein [Elusimicrobiota bacterium]
MKPYQNLTVDHMTLLLDPELYGVMYLVYRCVFGVAREDVLYDRRRPAAGGKGEVSMTFASRVGKGGPVGGTAMDNTIIATVQPSEPAGERSHVREMLADHAAAAHWQHIALRTPDLIAFHRHCLERGVNFITPILKDDHDDLIQVFSGELYHPGGKPSAVFFEFVQRNPSPEAVKMLEERNREAWFRDKTFLGLYQEKENEYRSGKVTPFLDPELHRSLQGLIAGRQVFELGDADVAAADKLMLAYGAAKARTPSTAR